VSLTCFEHASVHPQEALGNHISSLVDGRMCLILILSTTNSNILNFT